MTIETLLTALSQMDSGRHTLLTVKPRPHGNAMIEPLAVHVCYTNVWFAVLCCDFLLGFHMHLPFDFNANGHL